MDYQLYYDDELKHYGVIGMKWGVRRGRYSQSYAKGVKKLKKLDAKANKARARGAKYEMRSASKLAKGNYKKGFKLHGKSAKSDAKALRLENKGKKFYKKMEKTFAEVDVKNLNKADVEYGKKYAMRVLS